MMISRDDIIKAMQRGYIRSRFSLPPQKPNELIEDMADELMPLLDRYTQQILDRYISDGTTPSQHGAKQ